MSNNFKKIKQIREHVNSSRKQYLLIRNRFLWNQLLSSLDIIEDTELAIIDYIKVKEIKKLGLKYIYVFGILQVLYVQSDALKHLAESLNLDIKLDNTLIDIRDIRNDSIGHPTKRERNRKKPPSYHFIARMSLSHRNLSLMSIYPEFEEDTHFVDYDILELIKKQRKSVSHILEKAIELLGREQMKHKKEFNDVKLIDCFSPTLNYNFEKLYEFSWENTPVKIAKLNLNEIIESLTDFKDNLKKRDLLHAYVGVSIVLEELEYPLNRLKIFFNNENHLDNKDIFIYNFFIKNKFYELKEMAKEIDEEYVIDDK